MENNKINTKELRLGNLLHYVHQSNGKRELWKVVDILSSMPLGVLMEGGEPGYEKKNDIRYVQLTEELLLKAGFEKKSFKMSGSIVYEDSKYYILTNDNIEYALCIKGITPATWAISSFNYLHELQNLIFALDKREINVL